MTAADRPSVTDNARAVREAAMDLYRALRRANPDAWAEIDEVEDWAYWEDIVRTAQLTSAAGPAETTTEEWPRCKASRDGDCDRCHDEHGRHIHCRAETTTATDEDALADLAHLILDTLHFEPSTRDAEMDDVMDVLRRRLLATARTRPTREQIAFAIARGVDGMTSADYEDASDDYRNEMLEGADAVLALLADQPTEAEAGARALEQAAERLDADELAIAEYFADGLRAHAARLRAGGAS